MFAISKSRLEGYRQKGSSGSKALDYAINVLLRLDGGGYATSELALIETIGVAARVGGKAKANIVLKAVLQQEGILILETKALAYPLALAFTLDYDFEARDSLHLSAAIIGGVEAMVTSDTDFANIIERLTEVSNSEGFVMPTIVKNMYKLSDDEVSLLEKEVNLTLSALRVEQAPS